MSVKMGEISCAYHEGILSGPHALLLFSELNVFVTPEMVILRGLIPGLGSFPTLGGSESVPLVKHEENCFILSITEYFTGPRFRGQLRLGRLASVVPHRTRNALGFLQ